jgi:heptosyltransferase-2
MIAGRVLVRATNWVGDAVMSLPALRALRAAFPGAHLSVLARPWVAELYRRERAPDELILDTAARGPGDWAGKWRTARELRRRGFDCAVLFPNSFEAALVVRLAGIPCRIGYRRDGRGPLLTRAVPVPRRGEIPAHEAYYYLELLRRAGILDSLPDVETIELDRRTDALRAGRERLAALGFDGEVIGVSPGAAFGPAKRWMPERFAEAAGLVAAKRGAVIALFGSAVERELCEQIAGRIRRMGGKAFNLAGETTLGEFVELAAACSLFLSNDSGAMHVASALAVPTVAVFGPTDPWATGPKGPRVRLVREPLDCSPCKLRTCPIDHRCMRRIPAEAVAQAALELLA